MALITELDPNDPIIKTYDLAHALLREYGLDDWKFEFSREKRTLGHCYHDKKLIVFSSYFLDIPEHDIRDTLLHEIAHALIGPENGHNHVWKAKAREIGAKPDRLAPPHLKSSAKPNYYMECPDCGRRWYRYRMRRRNFGSRCPDCDTEVRIYKIRSK